MLLPFGSLSASRVLKSGDTMTGDLHIVSGNSSNGTKRLYLQTYEETGVSDYTEVMRIDMLTDSAKGAIAFRDKNLLTQTWIQQHDYLHFYNTQVIVSVDDPGDTVNVPNHGIPTGWKVTLTTTGTLPTGLAVLTTYYVRAVNANTLTFFNTSADAVANTNKITFTGTGSGIISVVPDNTYNFNRHKHFSIEVADSNGAKQSRFSIPYGYDTTEISIFNANLNIISNLQRILGAAGTDRQIIFGALPTSDYLPGSFSGLSRWALDADSIAESGSNAGTNFKISRFDDSGNFIDSPFSINRQTGLISVNNGAIGRTLFSASASGTVSNTNSETSVIGAGVGITLLPANFFVAGRTIKVHAKGLISTTGTPTLLINFKLGSVIVTASAVVTMPSSITNQSFMLEAAITCRVAGASGTFIGEGMLILANGTTPFTLGFATAGTSVVDTTGTQQIDLTATWGTANASNLISAKTLNIEAVF